MISLYSSSTEYEKDDINFDAYDVSHHHESSHDSHKEGGSVKITKMTQNINAESIRFKR